MKNTTIVFLVCFAISQNSLAQANFQDLTAQAGLSQIGLNNGVAIGDFNNDGLDDIFATRIFGQGVLYQNLGDGTFSNITSQVGIYTSPTAQFAVWGDVNNDGWLDLLI